MNMGIVQIDKDYYIEINKETENHEAKFNLHKDVDDGKGGFRKTYKSIGNYNSVKNACEGMIRYMTNKKVSKKKIASLSEYVVMLNESYEYVRDIFENKLNTNI